MMYNFRTEIGTRAKGLILSKDTIKTELIGTLKAENSTAAKGIATRQAEEYIRRNGEDWTVLKVTLNRSRRT